MKYASARKYQDFVPSGEWKKPELITLVRVGTIPASIPTSNPITLFEVQL